MSDTILRAKLIRLAHEHPELREQILPLVASEGMPKEANVSIAVNEIREFSMHLSLIHISEPTRPY